MCHSLIYRNPALIFVLVLFSTTQAKKTVDYNGTPLNTKGSITISPQTLPAILQSYRQSVVYDGLLDKTFNGNGIVTTSIGTLAQAKGCCLQPDGKIVTAGYSYNDVNFFFVLARYNTNGSHDATFGTGGEASYRPTSMELTVKQTPVSYNLIVK